MQHNLVPQFILDQHLDKKRSGRFSAVALFVDTSGFTPLTAHLEQFQTAGAETLANVLLAVFDPLIEAVYANGGFIAGFAGDAFKAIFPGIEQSSYEAALATAQTIREHMATHATYSTSYGDVPFAVRTGIASGEIEWGIWQTATPITDGQQAIYTFGGPALDLAIRGEGVADAGDIIITTSVFNALNNTAGFMAKPHTEADNYWRVGPLSVPLLRAKDQIATALTPPSITAATYFYPHSLLNQSSQGEFRRVLTLFINLQTLPDAASGQRFANTLFRLLDEYGGYICRLGRIGARDAGGTLLLFWGAPTSHENDVERVLNFVLDFQEQTNIPCRAGITYQIAYAGFVGSPRREEYTCYGLGVNLAARFMTSAPWGSIWVDEAVAQRAKKAFLLEHLHEQTFKGFSKPLPVYQLRRRRAFISTLFFKDMVGRQRELLQIASRIAPVRNGRFGGVITINGEAGIGKSHLVHECLTKTDFLSNGTLLLCQSDEILRESLNPFRYLLRHLFKQRTVLPEAENKANFDSILNQLIDETPEEGIRSELLRTRSFLGALIDLHWEESPYAQANPKLRLENTFIALKTLIKAESLRQPVVLQLEDIQWLDDHSRQFLLELVRNVADVPFIIVMTNRDTQLDLTFSEHIAHKTIQLKSLSRNSVVTLAQNILGNAVSPTLIRFLIERTDGNPFFVEQMTIYLRDQQLLHMTELGLEQQAVVSTLPNDLQAILVARIDQLTQEVRYVVQTAAVLGREFDMQVLSYILQEDQAISDKVKTAESAAIWSLLSELRYLFKHALLRDAAYNMQLQAQQRQLHHLAAEAILQLYPSDLAPYYADLVYHYRQAGRSDQEGRFALLAGKAAAAQFANNEALGYLQRALTLTSNPTQRFDILQVRRQIHNVLGQRDKERADIAALQELANMILDEKQAYRQAQAALAQTAFAEAIGEYEMAEQEAAATVEYAQRADDSETETFGRMRWTIALWWQGRYSEAKEQANTMLSVARNEQLPISEGHALMQLGNIAFLEGTFETAQYYYQQALPIYLAQNHANGAGPTLSNLGLVSKQIAPDQARAYFEQALTLYRQMGTRRGIAHALSSLAELEKDQGAYEAALEQTESVLSLVREIDDRNGELNCLGLFVNIYLRLGDYRRADQYAHEELSLCEELGNTRSKCVGLAKRGLLHYLQERYQLAVDTERQAIALADEIGLAQVKAMPRIYLGHALMRLERWSEAESVYGQAATLLEEHDDPQRRIELLAGMAQLALTQGNLTGATKYVQRIMTLLAEHSLERVMEPIQLYLICYEVLKPQDDKQAMEMLDTGYSLLQHQASLITDDQRRNQFIHIAAHRKLIDLYATSGRQS